MDGVRHRVELTARESYGKLLAYLAPRCGIDGAEEALADAFTAALERWPVDGIPHKPEAWLLTSARNKFIDRVRARQREHTLFERIAAAAREAQVAFEGAEEPQDTRLEMLFACAHPAIAQEMRAPLMLQLVLGLDAGRIASAFLIAPATMSQRLVRAKRKIAGAGIPLRVPEDDEFPARMQTVLSAIYAAFSTGWNDPLGDAAARDPADEAIWLARLVVKTCPAQPEAMGLLALMLHAHARRHARRNERGAFVPLDEQDVTRWEQRLIEEAEQTLAASARFGRPGRFQLEAAIQSAHAMRRFGSAPDWEAIVALYDALYELTASNVVQLNRAAALAHVRGPRDALEALEPLAGDERLFNYQPYWATRAELLAQAGDMERAQAAYERALGLTIDPAIRAYLITRHSVRYE